MHVVYTGERVRLRPFRDFAEFNVVHAEDYGIPDPFRGPRWWPVSRRAAEFGEDGMLDHGHYSMSAIDRLDTNELAGISGCSSYRSGALDMKVGTYILARHRGYGLGIEAKQLQLCRLFENYPLDAVRSSTMAQHSRARASLEACGMRCFGRLRAIECVEGRWYDEVNYEIFREDWEQMPIRGIVKRG